MSCKSPVIFLTFNRPGCSAQVFDRIRAAKPAILFLVQDGPRHRDDIDGCAAVRKIITSVDWPCAVHTFFPKKNLGCANCVSQGISKAFKEVDRAIILEDDCVPHPTFFRYCDELLERYAHDETVGLVSGNNYLQRYSPTGHSYYFSSCGLIWGWATWRRAWMAYDHTFSQWADPSVRIAIRSQLPLWAFHDYACVFDKILADPGKSSSWAYRWQLALFAKRMLCIIPSVNMIQNVGIGGAATHTTNTADPRMKNRAAKMTFPLRHPSKVYTDKRLTDALFTILSPYRGVSGLWKRPLKSLLSCIGLLRATQVIRSFLSRHP